VKHAVSGFGASIGGGPLYGQLRTGYSCGDCIAAQNHDIVGGLVKGKVWHRTGLYAEGNVALAKDFRFTFNDPVPIHRNQELSRDLSWMGGFGYEHHVGDDSVLRLGFRYDDYAERQHYFLTREHWNYRTFQTWGGDVGFTTYPGLVGIRVDAILQPWGHQSTWGQTAGLAAGSDRQSASNYGLTGGVDIPLKTHLNLFVDGQWSWRFSGRYSATHRQLLDETTQFRGVVVGLEFSTRKNK
jgi:hypothetical protein